MLEGGYCSMSFTIMILYPITAVFDSIKFIIYQLDLMANQS